MIRPERTSDAAAIFAVHGACFPTEAEGRLVGLLRDAARLAVSIVAESEGRIVGHVALSPVTAAVGDGGAGLAPVAVVAEFRRRGIAAELVRAALAAGRAAGFGWVVVLGEPEYYARFGFRAAAEFGLSDEYGGGPAFQALELVPGALAGVSGLVRYAPEFGSLG